MKHDITAVLIKHIQELYQILDKYNISDKLNFISEAETDMIFQKAILMSVGYIGELSKKLDDDIKKANPNVNWRRLSTSRNIIFHDYDIVDMEIISSVIFRDISSLRLMKEVDSKDIKQAIDLVINVFTEFVAPDYSDQGKNAFENYLKNKYEEISCGSIFENSGGRYIFACYQEGKIVGVIATKNHHSRISLMFVDKQYHKSGVSKHMFNFVLEKVKQIGVIPQITVSSSPYAVKVYEHLGFMKTGDQQETDGIIFIPMIYTEK